MRLLIALKEPFLPEVIGGGVLCLHQMALQFLDLGHECEVLAGLSPGFTRVSYQIGCLFLGKGAIGLRDEKNGYVTTRSAGSGVYQQLRRRLEEWQPHVVITQGEGREELARYAVNMGYPTIVRLVTTDCVEALARAERRDAEIAKILRGPRVLLVSVSNFIAKRAKESLGIETPVVPVLIRFTDYIATRRDPHWVTFVNPTKVKGLQLALDIAAILPHRKFLFVESWPLNAAARAELDVRLKSVPNVSFRSRSLQMLDVYQRTSVLLVPSQCEEAFGRVIVEAAANGIPAVASRIGGIPEAIAEGGILLSPTDRPERWASEVERILSDNVHYAKLSKQASLNAGRVELNPEFVAQRFLQVAEEHISKCRL